jgi:hypothetical protein
MTAYLFSPSLGFWVGALILNAVVWLITINARPSLKTNMRALILSITISPSLVPNIGGHLGTKEHFYPLLAVVVEIFSDPELLLFIFTINSIQFFILWAVLTYSFRRIFKFQTPTAKATK